MTRIPDFTKIDLGSAPAPAPASAPAAVGEAYTTPEGIPVKPVYAAADTPELDFLDTFPGIAAFPARPLPDHVRRRSRGPSASTRASPRPRILTPSTAATSPPVRRACRSPSISPPTAATTPTIRASWATSAWRASRSTPSTTCARCSTASRSQMSRVDDHERRGAAGAGALHRRGRGAGRAAGQTLPAPSRTTFSKSSWCATPTSTRLRPRCGSSPTSSPTPAANMPKFNSISISGYHMQEAGATADLELAYTLADGIEYVARRHRRRSRHRRVCAAPVVLLGDRHELLHGDRQDARRAPACGRSSSRRSSSPKDSRSLSLRTHSQTSGWSLTAQDVFNNVDPHLRSKRWPPRRATRSRCTPTRLMRRSRCRPTSRPASPATRSCSSSRKAAPAAPSIPGAAATTSSG